MGDVDLSEHNEGLDRSLAFLPAEPVAEELGVATCDFNEDVFEGAATRVALVEIGEARYHRSVVSSEDAEKRRNFVEVTDRAAGHSGEHFSQLFFVEALLEHRLKGGLVLRRRRR